MQSGIFRNSVIFPTPVAKWIFKACHHGRTSPRSFEAKDRNSALTLCDKGECVGSWLQTMWQGRLIPEYKAATLVLSHWCPPLWLLTLNYSFISALTSYTGVTAYHLATSLATLCFLSARQKNRASLLIQWSWAKGKEQQPSIQPGDSPGEEILPQDALCSSTETKRQFSAIQKPVYPWSYRLIPTHTNQTQLLHWHFSQYIVMEI